MNTTYILILNWNGWKDTIECLESVFRIAYPDCRVVLCDNGSTDGSLEQIKAWAEGHLDVWLPKDSPLRHLSFPPVPKPMRCVEYNRAQAEMGGRPDDMNAPLVLIQTGANLGFAGGNNVGLRYALAQDDFEYVWLLNNDSVIQADALTHMVRRMEERPRAGMCGSTLLYYHEPDKVQALGGARYNKWLGVTRPIGLLQPANLPVNTDYVERRMSYVAGASMLVSRSFLCEIGLMCEDYFMYYEELDWALRAHGAFGLAYARDAIVYHKEGVSIGATARQVNEKSWVSDYHSVRNRLALTRKFVPLALPTVYLGLLGIIVNRMLRRQWDRVGMVARIMLFGQNHVSSTSPRDERVG